MLLKKYSIKLILLTTLCTIPFISSISAQESNTTRFSRISLNKIKLRLTEEEAIWLKEHPKVRIGVMNAWPPLSFINNENAPEGIAIDYINELNKHLDNLLEIVPKKWHDIYNEVKNQELDAAMDITPREHRKEFFWFTKPHLTIPHVIVSRKDATKLNNENDLKGKTLSLEKSFVNVSYFQKNYPDVRIVEYPNSSEALCAVSRGEVYAYAGNLAVAIHIMQNEMLTNLKIQGRLSKTGSVLAIGTRKDYPILRDILQKALDAISLQQKNTIYQKWCPAPTKYTFDPSWLWKIGLGLFTAICFVAFSNIRLRNAVKKRTEELSASEAQYRTLFESAKDGILILNTDGIFTMCNYKALELLDYAKEQDIIGLSPKDISPETQPDGQSSEKESKIKITKTLEGNPQIFEWLHQKQNGEIFPADITLTPIKIRRDLRILVIMRDISEKRNTERELKVAKQKAETSDKLKTAFLASLSHEIRTPMNGILGFSDLLHNNQLPMDLQKEYLNNIEESGSRMMNIIDDLINISKIETGQVVLQVKKHNANKFIDYAYNVFKPQSEKKGIKLRTHKTLDDKDSFIHMDNDKIFQVLSNLITNSLKFTETGEIHFGYKKKNNVFEFYVKDTGIGIAPDMHDTIFDRFRQIEDTNSRSREGSGLGLSISKAFIEHHGGKIWVDSRINHGSTFYFTIPAYK